jgi:hypothetical protein
MRWRGAMLALFVAACGSGDGRMGTRAMPVEAYCEAAVVGIGYVDVEGDYLPHVVNCENGNASLEALKAQAVAARSYLYYKLDVYGEISDGTGDQVYTCGREPAMEHYLAVDATSGQVLMYEGVQVAAFYVAGALQDPPDCTGGTYDPTNTERFVTYNQGTSGDDVEQTTLGFVDPSNKANRGCMSQNGSDCLAEAGWLWESILRFYYGEDIEITRAEGPCVEVSEPDAGPVDAGLDGAADAGSGAGGGDGWFLGGCAATSSAGRAMLPTAVALIFMLFAFVRGRRR